MRYEDRGSIKEWAQEDRPREKLIQRGKSALTDAELVAILLGSGSRKLSAIDLARQILDRFGGLQQLARADVNALTQFDGMGPAKAISLIAAFELARRKEMDTIAEVRVNSSQSSAAYLMPRMVDLDHEVCYVLLLNRNNVIIAEKMISQGGVSSTIMDPKMIFREAINHLATAVIVAHNHPSGNLQPSHADITITHRLVAGGQMLDIAVLDHLIISRKGFFSFADEDMMMPQPPK